MSIEPIRTPWPGRMSARERFTRQLRREPFDRCFNMEFGYWEENFQSWRLFRDRGVTTNAEADRFFAFDRCEARGGRCWMWPSFPEETIETRDGKRILRNAEGLLAEVPADNHSTIPHFLESSIKTPDDWEKVKRERFRVDDPDRRVDLEAFQRTVPAERDYPVGVNCGSMIGKVRDLLTFEGLAYAVYDYPAMVEDMVETACRLVEHFLDQVLPHVAFDFAAGWEDICYKSGPIVSVDFFREVVVPRYRRIRAKLDAAGIDLWYTDCDGDIRALLPLFLEGGINTLFPLEVNGSGHPGDLLREYGTDLRIMGGVDKMVLRKGPEAIRAYLDSLAPWVEQGGFIPFCDHRCPPDVKEEDYLFYLDLKQDLFGRLR